MADGTGAAAAAGGSTGGDTGAKGAAAPVDAKVAQPGGDVKVDTKAAPAPRKWEPYEYEDEDEVDAEGKPKKYRFETEHDFKQHLRKGSGAQRKFDEAAKVRKEWSEKQQTLQAFEKAFQANPAAAMRKYAKELGIPEERLRAALTDDDEEARALEELKQKDPRQYQLLTLAREQEEKLAKYEAERAEATEKEKRATFERQVQEQHKRWEADTADVVKQLVEYGDEGRDSLVPIIHDRMRIARQGGYRIPPAALAEETRRVVGQFVEGHLSKLPPEAFGKVMGDRLTKMPADALEKLLGEARVTELARRAAERIRGGRTVKPATRKDLPPEEKAKHGWDGSRGTLDVEPYFPVGHPLHKPVKR
jgi:hypothetical protein